MNEITQAINRGFEMGMFQHREEIADFLVWLRHRLKGHLGPTMEIGGHRGGTASMFCTLSEDTVISIDKPDGEWGGVGFQSARERDLILDHLYHPRYIGINADSHDPKTVDDVSRFMPNGSCDLLFIDGDHSYNGVRQDFDDYKKFVRTRGIVAFHDINDTPLHRERGVEVPRFWKELEGDKHEFTIDADWGGIGALIL